MLRSNALQEIQSALRARLDRGEAIDIRGDGKAGGGLVLAFQALGAAAAGAGFDTQEWPLFSSARKGANVRAYLRLARRPIEMACAIQHPDIAVLMNEAAAQEIDFAEGTTQGIYAVNTSASPEQVAERYRLAGAIVAIDGDELGRKFLSRPLGNVALFAALVLATDIIELGAARRSLATALGKRRLPPALLEANLALFDEACARANVHIRTADGATRHDLPPLAGYARLPAGAQSALRSSRGNRTAVYGRPGVRIEFHDATSRCNGCSLCVMQCPEGIIEFRADPTRGAIVHGARFADYCKACRECVAACPLDLFSEVPASMPLQTEGA